MKLRCCKKRYASGRRCRFAAVRDGLCMVHHPSTARARETSRRTNRYTIRQRTVRIAEGGTYGNRLDGHLGPFAEYWMPLMDRAYRQGYESASAKYRARMAAAR